MLLMNQEPGSDKVNILVYGRSGTGKTTLGVTAPKPIQKMMDQTEFLQKVSNERFLYMIPYIMNTEMQ